MSYNFFLSKNKICENLDIEDARKFYMMLLKMKEKRINFNVDYVMILIYGDLNFKKIVKK